MCKYKKKAIFVILVLSLVIIASTSILAASVFYTIDYDSMPSDVQDNLLYDFYDSYRNYDVGLSYYSFNDFKDLCTAFSTDSSPEWNSVYDWIGTNIKYNSTFTNYINNNDISLAARCIYAECSDLTSYRQTCMRCVADVIANRAQYSAYGGPTINGAVLAGFCCAEDGNIGFNNPVYYEDDADAFGYAAMLDYHLDQGLGAVYTLPNSLYFNFYDISDSMPFYIYNGSTYIQCTISNVTQATHQKFGSIYEPLKTFAPMIKYGSMVFYSY